MARAMGPTCEAEGATIDAQGWCWIDDASKCPGGCAIDMRCGTEKECEVAGIALTIGCSIFGGICLLVCCCVCFGACRAAKETSKAIKDANHTTSTDHDRKEPLLDGAYNPEAQFMQQNLNNQN